MELTRIEQSLLVAAFFRGGKPPGPGWRSNTDQVLTLSLFYTGDISFEDCAERFSVKGYVRRLYTDRGLTDVITSRYAHFIALIRSHPELIEAGGNFEPPADPTYTACRLTEAGEKLACSLIQSFPRKPEFPNWPDKRIAPDSL